MTFSRQTNTFGVRTSRFFFPFPLVSTHSRSIYFQKSSVEFRNSWKPMAEEIEKSMPAEQSLMDKISEKIHHHDSSSDSEYEKPDSPSAVKAKIYRLFGREKPVHKVLGGGKRTSLTFYRFTLYIYGLIVLLVLMRWSAISESSYYSFYRSDCWWCDA